MITNDSALHLGNLLQQKLQEQTMQQDYQATITSLQEEIEQLKTKLLNQRNITQEWANHAQKTEALYNEVRHIVEDIIYGKSFHEHLMLKANELIASNGLNNTIDYNKLVETIDYDTLASKIDLGELAADHIDMSDLADQIASNVDTSDIASEIDLSDLASFIDMSDLADDISYSELASELSTKVRVSVDFAY
jgi:FtsZ-binding cell division protein ZapB